jgi:signal transduction histidine kinase/PAS domain-containing protein
MVKQRTQGTTPETVAREDARPPDPTHIRVFTRDRPAAFRYGITLLGIAAATLLTALFQDALARTILIVFWPVVTAAAWYMGRGPAIMASALSVFIADYLFIPPLHSFRPGSTEDIFSILTFLAMTYMVSAVFERARANELQAIRFAAENSTYAQRLKERSHAAAQAERFSRSIVDSITDPFVVFDTAWRFRYINEAAARVFERAGHGQMKDHVLWEEYPQLIGTDFERNMRRAAETGETISFEAYYEHTGEWSVTYCYPLPEGGIAAQWRNISERKRTEETNHYLTLATATLAASLDYEETLARLAAVLVPQLGDWCVVHLRDGTELKQVAVAHVDPGKIEYAREINSRYPTSEDATTGVPNVIRSGVAEVYRDVTDEMIAAGARDDEHLRIMRELKIRSVIIAPLLGKDAAIGAITLVSAESGRRYNDADVPLVMEIGRRAALAVENARLHQSALEAKSRAERLQKEAETANVTKTQFLTSMSHELRTPLNAIAGYADLMSLGVHGPITDAQAEDIERIKRNQRHLLGIINDILSFARLDAGRVEFHITNFAAYDVVDDLHPMIRPQIAGRELHFEAEPIPADVMVRADREKVRQVLLNLLSNAIKFTMPGGSIRLSCHADNHVVEFAVRDTGIGIPADKVAAIFEPFVQVNRSLAQPVEGTGLGLAISRDMVEGMGGTLTVVSEVGTGSTFTVTLPRAL